MPNGLEKGTPERVDGAVVPIESGEGGEIRIRETPRQHGGRLGDLGIRPRAHHRAEGGGAAIRSALGHRRGRGRESGSRGGARGLDELKKGSLIPKASLSSHFAIGLPLSRKPRGHLPERLGGLGAALLLQLHTMAATPEVPVTSEATESAKEKECRSAASISSEEAETESAAETGDEKTRSHR